MRPSALIHLGLHLVKAPLMGQVPMQAVILALQQLGGSQAADAAILQ